MNNDVDAYDDQILVNLSPKLSLRARKALQQCEFKNGIFKSWADLCYRVFSLNELLVMPRCGAVTDTEIRTTIQDMTCPGLQPYDDLYDRLVFKMLECGVMDTAKIIKTASTLSASIRGERISFLRTAPIEQETNNTEPAAG